jgi:hypothetical protein
MLNRFQPNKHNQNKNECCHKLVIVTHKVSDHQVIVNAISVSPPPTHFISSQWWV